MAQAAGIFVSHPHEDNAWCRASVQALKQAGPSAWYDEHKLGYGVIGEEIERELRARHIFIVIVSPASVGRPWVRREMSAAMSLRDQEPERIILQVVAEKVETLLFWTDYKGVSRPGDTARQTRLQASTAFLDQLLDDGETTSVDFKRELHLDKDNEKAEFVKDVLALATTQATGRRWLIIGIDDKTRAFHAAPGADITQNRLEQILGVYTAPQVQVRYEVVSYRGNQVGKIEILRDRRHLPYHVAKSIGGGRRIEEDEIFVHHGSQTEHPSDAELQAIQEEGDRARRAAAEQE